MNSARIISFITRSAVAIILLVISISIVTALIRTKPVIEVKEGDRALVGVVVLEAHPIPVKRRTLGFGVADSLNHADVPTQLSSTVVAVPSSSRAGRQVRKGDLLIELDDVDFRQQLIRAEQALATVRSDHNLLLVERDAAEERSILAANDQALAETELARVIEAFDRGAAKQREVDTTRQQLIAVTSVAVNAKEAADRFPSREEQNASTLTSRGADLEMARENLRRCKIVSPIDGVLQSIDVRVGEIVQIGTRVARVVHSGIMEIPLRLPSYSRSYIRVGDKVTLYSAGYGVRSWDARIARIAPEDDTQTRTMIVYIDYEQDPFSATRIPPGLFVRGEVVETQESKPKWIVPRRALREERVMVVRDSILRNLPVQIEFSIADDFPEFGLPDRDWAVLHTALLEGDLVVVDPGSGLRDGMPVRAILTSEVSFE